MYTGNINIEHDKVHKFIEMSKKLQIRGISTSTSSHNSNLHNQQNNSYSEQKTQFLTEASTPAQNYSRSVKRKRLSSERNKVGGKVETDNRQKDQILNQENSSIEDSVVIKTEPFLQVGIVEDEANQIIIKDDQIEIKPDPDQITEQNPKENDDNYYSARIVNRESEEEAESNITPSLSVRSDLLHVTGNSVGGSSRNQSSSEPAKIIKKWSSDMDRCHFCSVHCGNQEALTLHLKTVHMPPKHALCENCENFFHVCAIVRHRAKCHQKLAQFSTLSSLL